ARGGDHAADALAHAERTVQSHWRYLLAVAAAPSARRADAPPARVADERRHLRASALRRHAFRDGGAARARARVAHAHRERRVEGVRHDRMAPRLWRWTGRPHRGDARGPEPEHVESIVDQPGCGHRGARWTAAPSRHMARALSQAPRQRGRQAECHRRHPLSHARRSVLRLRELCGAHRPAHAGGRHDQRRRRVLPLSARRGGRCRRTGELLRARPLLPHLVCGIGCRPRRGMRARRARVRAAAMTRHVAVIGAGAVGVMCAIHALRAGHRVTIVEPESPGGEQAASFGNSGWLSSHSVIPPAEPGVWRKVPGYLADPLGPIAIRWRYLPRATPWLVRYVASAATPQRLLATARALRTLLVDAPKLHAELAASAGVPDLVVQSGVLHVYRSKAAFERDALGWEVRRSVGVRYETIEGDALRAQEPDLAADYAFAVRVAEAGHCRDPSAYVHALFVHARSLGAEHVAARATGFQIERSRVRAVRTQSGDIDCDAAVIAAGIRSRALAAAAGDRVPLET